MLLQNHIIKWLLELRHINNNNIHQLFLERLTPRQWLNIKDPIVDANNKLNGVFNPLLLDLTTLGGPILHPKETWYDLRFIFDRKLTFQQHINFYTNKAILTVKCMKMLGNLAKGLIPTQKWLLYRNCVLSITLYSFQL